MSDHDKLKKIYDKWIEFFIDLITRGCLTSPHYTSKDKGFSEFGIDLIRYIPNYSKINKANKMLYDIQIQFKPGYYGAWSFHELISIVSDSHLTSNWLKYDIPKDNKSGLKNLSFEKMEVVFKPGYVYTYGIIDIWFYGEIEKE